MTETMVYCGACGAALSATARFCRACGVPQGSFADSHPAATQPPPPPAHPPAPQPQMGAWSQRQVAEERWAPLLAIAGGAGMCLMVLYAIVYYPRHHDYPVNFGESLQFGDLLALGSGALAVVLGVFALRLWPLNPARNGLLLVLAGAPTLVLLLLWAYPETFNLSYYPQPFYFGFVYYADWGQAHIGSGYVQLPLLASSTAVVISGYLMGFRR